MENYAPQYLQMTSNDKFCNMHHAICACNTVNTKTSLSSKTANTRNKHCKNQGFLTQKITYLVLWC